MRRSLRASQPAEGVSQHVGGKIRVESGEGVAQALFQEHLSVVGALGGQCVGGDIRPVGTLQPWLSNQVRAADSTVDSETLRSLIVAFSL